MSGITGSENADNVCCAYSGPAVERATSVQPTNLVIWSSSPLPCRPDCRQDSRRLRRELRAWGSGL